MEGFSTSEEDPCQTTENAVSTKDLQDSLTVGEGRDSSLVGASLTPGGPIARECSSLSAYLLVRLSMTIPRNVSGFMKPFPHFLSKGFVTPLARIALAVAPFFN